MLHHLLQCALTEIASLRPEQCREEPVPVEKTGWKWFHRKQCQFLVLCPLWTLLTPVNSEQF